MQLSEQQLLHAYRQMKLIREFEERTQREIMLGQIPGFTHVYSGQEANAVGVCEHLSERTTSLVHIAATVTASPRAATWKP